MRLSWKWIKLSRNTSQKIGIELMRRASRDGYKAGALQAALNRTEEEFIAIFDADFLPPADFPPAQPALPGPG